MLPVSALTGAGVDDLLAAMGAALDGKRHSRDLRLSFAEGRKRAWLYEQGVIDSEERGEDGYRLQVTWTARQEKRFRDL